jgi:hypothetical protein
MAEKFPEISAPAGVPSEVEDYMYRVFEQINQYFANKILIEYVDEIPVKAEDGDVVFADHALGAPPFTGAGFFGYVSGGWTKL